MDYLRTLGSAAVSSLVQKSGLNLPFSLGAKVTSLQGIWTLYDGTKRDDGSLVSIFEYDLNDPSRKMVLPLAKNALRKLRTTRHPDVLKFVDAVETDTTMHIVTERVRPLTTTLPSWSSRGDKEKEDWLLWGLHRISVALAFLNDSCDSTHGNLCVNSIFISPSGEWKLGGFELLSSSKDELAVLYTMGGMIPNSSAWASPEVRKGGWSVMKEQNPAAADGYALGVLLHAIFNPSQPPPATIEPPYPPPQPSSRKSIPISVFPSFKRLLNPNPKPRLSPKAFLDIGMGQAGVEGSGFFSNNSLVKVCMGLDNFNLASESDKTALLRTLTESASSFPAEFASFRVLPSLISALEFGGAPATAVLPLILQLGKSVSQTDYPSVVLAPLLNLFASPERETRMTLLNHLSEYADKLDKKAVVDKIWPHLQTGFSDTIAIIREATVKSIIVLSPKLSDRILNNDLLRYLAKLQSDPEASIRTNTCILIGRLGPSLSYNTKRKILVPAFTKALKDPFVHARAAGLMALMATIDCFEIEELASKVIPNMSFVLLDKEKLVRDQAFKAVDLFIKRLESHAAIMPDTEVTEPATLSNGISSPANSAAGAASALAGWAISSIGKQIATTDLQSTIGSNVLDRANAAVAPPAKDTLLPTSSLTFSQLSISASSTLSTPGSFSRSKGMQLGSNKALGSVVSATLADQLVEEAVAADGVDANPWGTGDLIDINADEDDWSAFESAPAAEPKTVSNSWAVDDATLGNDITQPTYPTLSTQSQKYLERNSTMPSLAASDQKTTRVPSPPGTESDWDSIAMKGPAGPTFSPVTSLARMSKEEKSAEIARRKEERKQRIAQLKEQKKNAGRSEH